jgi:aminopeptidase YwaD
MIKSLVLVLLISVAVPTFAQRRSKKKKKDQATPIVQLINTAALYQHINVLASDSLQGRRTGTLGEQLAMSYIKNKMIDYGILPQGTNGSYLQTFAINDGLQYETFSSFSINEKPISPGKDFFPLNQSSNASMEEIIAPSLKSQGSIWFLDVNDELKKQEKNPHYDINPFIDDKIKNYEENGASAMLIYNSGKLTDNLSFNKKEKKTTAKIPVIYISKEIAKQYIKNPNNVIDVKFTIEIQEKKRNGTNVVGFVNNNANQTIILGAHYDHLGYGEDKNSLYAGKELLIHNGADDNASGVAALLELSKILKESSFKKNNYLIIAFSGEELGLYGSKYFTENPTIDMATVNYMINMDMIGRLNDSTKAFTVGGYGTSPTWATVIKAGLQPDTLTIKTDSSGTGPSDHSSFYRKNIPVLFLFTGTHSDYHKPDDDIEKINIKGVEKIVGYVYNVVKQTNDLPKLEFLKTRENSSAGSSTRFTVSLGIMPDYTYSGVGVRADGISEGKLAQKIGLQAGDVLTKLGDNNISSVESYMKVLSKFKKGDSTVLIVNRAGKEMQYNITF